jgi:cell division protein FtsB
LVLSFQSLLRGVGRRSGYILAVVVVGGYGWIALHGPQGVQVLLEKRRQIRQLEDQNATMARENERRKDRIHRLEDSSSEQEMEIRKQLKLLRPGETTFILPDAPKDSGHSGDSGAATLNASPDDPR